MTEGRWAGGSIHTGTGRKGWELSDNQSKEAAASLDAPGAGRDALGWDNPAGDGSSTPGTLARQGTEGAG